MIMPEFEGALTTAESTELYKLCDVSHNVRVEENSGHLEEPQDFPTFLRATFLIPVSPPHPHSCPSPTRQPPRFGCTSKHAVPSTWATITQ